MVSVTDYTVKIRNFLHHFLKVDQYVSITSDYIIDLMVNLIQIKGCAVEDSE